MSAMMDLIRRMEGQGDRMRQEILMTELEAHNWLYYLQSYTYAEEEGHNIILESVQQGHPETVLLVAHYDRFFDSPGANDDASACAILLDVASRLQGTTLGRNVRIVFFDDEEPTINWRRPIGSSFYVNDIGTKGVHAVVNLELNGMGDAIGIWPVDGIQDRPVLQDVISVIKEQDIPYEFGKRIPGFYGDYLPFRESGFQDAFCLTTFHWKERKTVFAFGEGQPWKTHMRYIAWKKLGIKTVPTIFQHYHTEMDSSKYLSEDTLQMMSDLIFKITLRLCKT